MEICVWCCNGMKGHNSNFYGLCSNCRKSKDGKRYLKDVYLGLNKREGYKFT